VFASLLLAGRLIHAYGVSQLKEKLIFRMVGMILSFASIGLTSLVLLYTVYEGTAV
jgi:uncharacterized membrane protein YecN with MAPEG domain